MHLLMYNSNHSPIWIRSGTSLIQHSNQKPFQFLSAWLGHEGFVDLVHSNWSGAHAWQENVFTFTATARL